MNIETRFGNLILDHCQKNSDGLLFNDDVKKAIQVQLPDLLNHITFDNSVWLNSTATKSMVTRYDRQIDNQVKARQLKELQELEANSKKLICCFSPTFLGRTFEVGVSHDEPLSQKTTLQAVIYLIEKSIEDPTVSLRERDYLSSCRYSLLTSRKRQNDTIYIANKLGLKEQDTNDATN
ncbi:hypothetical protein MOU92_004174 [Vibrio parahaemolyticus]|nr:hypothetical protein [Vibrio parahaemolyticus]